jgi:hypothetical protein
VSAVSVIAQKSAASSPHRHSIGAAANSFAHQRYDFSHSTIIHPQSDVKCSCFEAKSIGEDLSLCVFVVDALAIIAAQKRQAGYLTFFVNSFAMASLDS